MQVLVKKVQVPVLDQPQLALKEGVLEAWTNTKVVETSKEDDAQWLTLWEWQDDIGRQEETACFIWRRQDDSLRTS